MQKSKQIQKKCSARLIYFVHFCTVLSSSEFQHRISHWGRPLSIGERVEQNSKMESFLNRKQSLTNGDVVCRIRRRLAVGKHEPALFQSLKDKDATVFLRMKTLCRLLGLSNDFSARPLRALYFFTFAFFHFSQLNGSTCQIVFFAPRRFMYDVDFVTHIGCEITTRSLSTKSFVGHPENIVGPLPASIVVSSIISSTFTDAVSLPILPTLHRRMLKILIPMNGGSFFVFRCSKRALPRMSFSFIDAFFSLSRSRAIDNLKVLYCFSANLTLAFHAALSRPCIDFGNKS